MKQKAAGLPSIKNLGAAARRRKISVSPEELVTERSMFPDGDLPLLIEPAVENLSLTAWVDKHRDIVEERLLRCGGILFRGFELEGTEEFQAFMRAASRGALLEYRYRSTPRSEVSGRVYSSTEYPSDQSIPLHNEMSYCRFWPLKIWFFCARAAAEGGQTPIADSRKVLRRLRPETKRRFIEKRVLYVRNYGKRLDLPWQDVFQCDQRSKVEDFCRHEGIDVEWLSEDRLRTSQVCQAVAAHPTSREEVWFNQAHLFHVSSLSSELQESLLSAYSSDELPRNTYYGDGSPIPLDVLEEIRAVYREESVHFDWQEGDILMLDNMLVAHGRTPFVGERRILVGMAEESGSEGA